MTIARYFVHLCLYDIADAWKEREEHERQHSTEAYIYGRKSFKRDYEASAVHFLCVNILFDDCCHPKLLHLPHPPWPALLYTQINPSFLP